jgi:hypothetical protein
MKIKMTKGSLERFCQDTEQELLESAGWRLTQQEQAGEEVIRLKPPTVKSKATVTAVEEANINQQGDE